LNTYAVAFAAKPNTDVVAQINETNTSCFVFPMQSIWTPVVIPKTDESLAGLVSKNVSCTVVEMKLLQTSWKLAIYEDGAVTCSYICEWDEDGFHVDPSGLDFSVIARLSDRASRGYTVDANDVDISKVNDLSDQLRDFRNADLDSLRALLENPNSWSARIDDKMIDMQLSEALNLGELEELNFDDLDRYYSESREAFETMYPGAIRIGKRQICPNVNRC